MELRDAYEACRQITLRHARTFYFASLFIPRTKRLACYAVYAFCRYVDDIVDVAMEAGDVTREGAVQLVNTWRADVAALYDGRTTEGSGRDPAAAAVLMAWEDTIRQFDIPRSLPEELIEGVLMDTEVRRFATFDDLRRYCYLVASTVGLMTSKIFRYSADEALTHAIDLGIAMQLTNIIRDVREDAIKGRIYLPLEDLQQFGVTEMDILHQRNSPQVRALIRSYVQKADAYYDSADAGIPYLDPDSRLTVQLMSTNYRKILREIERADYNVFAGRASTTTIQKLITIPASWYKVTRNSK